MRASSPQGFSTLEMLIAMALLISAFTVTLLLSSSQSISVDSETSAEALTLARKSLENEQSLARKDFKLVVATTSVETVGGTPYTKAVSVSQFDYFTKKVIATVSWPGTFGRKPSTSLTALLTDFANAVGGDTCSSVVSGDWTHPKVANSGHQDLATIFGNASGVYSVSDIDAYQGRLYISVNNSGSPTVAGPDTSAANAADVPLASAIAWSNPANGKTSNGAYATSASGLNNTRTTDYLRITGFGFSIPSWATITGIKVRIQKSRGSAGVGSVLDSQVKIVKNNAIGGTANISKPDGSGWPATIGYTTYTTDLWGESWTPADINSANFGVAISATGSSGGSRTAQVDNAEITVYYTAQFYVLNLANPANPTLLGALGSNTVSTGINAVAVATSSSNAFAYVATNSTTGQLQIIDISDPAAPSVASTYVIPSPSGATAKSIFYKNGYVYLGLYATGSGAEKEFQIVDVSNPYSPKTVSGGYWPPAPPSGSFSSFNNDINSVFVKDGYAYLTTPFSPELIALNITNPASPTVAGTYDAPDTAGNGKIVYPVGDTLYFGRTVTAANREYSVLDGSDLPQLQANNTAPITKEIGSSIFGLIVRDSLAYLLTTKQGSTPGNLQIINATSTALVGSAALPGGTSATGVALDCEGNYLYAASVDSAGKGSLTAVTGQ